MIRSFIRDESATVSTEAIIAMPILLFVFAATFLWWDGYRTAMTAQKSTFTISDLISREDYGDGIDQAYLDGMNKMFRFLTNEETGTSIRVSIVQRKLRDNGNAYNALVWAHVSGDKFAPLTGIRDIRDSIPRIAVGRQIIVVETHLEWDPAVRGVAPPIDTYTIVTTNPRSAAPQINWDDGSSSS